MISACVPHWLQAEGVRSLTAECCQFCHCIVGRFTYRLAQYLWLVEVSLHLLCGNHMLNFTLAFCDGNKTLQFSFCKKTENFYLMVNNECLY